MVGPNPLSRWALFLIHFSRNDTSAQDKSSYWDQQRRIDEETKKHNAYVPQRQGDWKVESKGETQMGQVGTKVVPVFLYS